MGLNIIQITQICLQHYKLSSQGSQEPFCADRKQRALLYHRWCDGGRQTDSSKAHATALYCVFAQLRESVSLGDVIHRPWPTVNKTVELDS